MDFVLHSVPARLVPGSVLGLAGLDSVDSEQG